MIVGPLNGQKHRMSIPWTHYVYPVGNIVSNFISWDTYPVVNVHPRDIHDCISRGLYPVGDVLYPVGNHISFWVLLMVDV